MFVNRWCWIPLFVLALSPFAAAHDEDPVHLLGRCTEQQLAEAPFAEWYREGHDAYAPHPDFLEALRGALREDTTFVIFFGTWCGDSRREVPRMLRLFEAMGISKDRIELVGVDRAAGAIKRSPDGEEIGREIYRVPTLIVERNGEEISRLVEHPVLSLERDLLSMLDGSDYEPSYPAYPIIRRWLAEGLLSDPNVNPWGLAGLVRPLISGEGDVAAAARVLQSRGDLAEAIKLFEVNCALYRESASCHHRLAAALLESGDREAARRSAERALRYNEDPERSKELAELLAEIGS